MNVNWFWKRILRLRTRPVKQPPLVSQPVPGVTPEDVTRLIRRDFALYQVADVTAVLQDCGGDDSRISARVRIACLKLANGDVEQLQKIVNLAKQDYRDVLTPAEYPEYSRKAWGKNLPAAELHRIYESDWSQYQDWLERKS
jgi:hypothetical protein